MARILLADDDLATRELVKRALEAEGHAVEVTQDGSEAMEKLGAPGAVDLLVSDVHMPGLDGVELAQRAIAAMLALKLLFMSGFTEELERAKGVKASKVGIISKPFTLEQIRSAVRVLLE